MYINGIKWLIGALVVSWACYIGGKLFVKAVRGKKLELRLRNLIPSDSFIAWDKGIDIHKLFIDRIKNEENESKTL